jgi:hypothetical protein
MLQRSRLAAMTLAERDAPTGPCAARDVPPAFQIVRNEMVRNLLLSREVVTRPPSTQIPGRRPTREGVRVAYQHD